MRGIAAGVASCALSSALCSLPAAAQVGPATVAQSTPLLFLVGASIASDSNVFRLPDSAPDPQVANGIPGRSDRYVTAHLGLRLDKAYSQQRVQLDVIDRVIRYDKFSSLDRNELDYRGEWQWHLSPRINGTLRAERSEALVGFENTQAQQQNVTVRKNYGAAADARLFGGWHLLAGALASERKSSQVFLTQPDSTQTGWDAGLRYVTESQNSMTYTRRSRTGNNTGQSVDLVNFIDSDFSIAENEVAVTWSPGSHHALNGRITRVDYRHEHVPQRDFAGNAGELTYTWIPFGGLSLSLSSVRTIQSWTPDTSASYRVDDTISFASSWQTTAKTSVQMRASRMASDFLGAVVPVPGPSRQDILNVLQITASWAPYGGLTLSSSLSRQRRASTDFRFEFDATLFSLNAELMF